MTKSTSKRRETAPTTANTVPAAKGGKLAAIVDLLQRPTGASLAELMAATGWQAHSVRGALSGHVRGKLKLPLVSEKTEAGRLYRLPVEAAA